MTESQVTKETMVKVKTTLLILAAALATVLFKPALSAPVHIEVVVFSTNIEKSGHEWFFKPKELFKVKKFIDENISFNDPDEEQEPVASGGPTPVDAYVLTDFAKAIENHPDIELLNYISWVQEPVPKSRTQPISLDITREDSILSSDLLLAGEVSVYEIAQLLQFDVSVTYKPEADQEQETLYLPEAVIRYVPAVSYLLEDRRQVQINDIHYFDHPKFGILFTIIRPKQPELGIQ